MITKETAKIVGLLPKPVVRWFASMLVNKYLSKYANIMVVNKNKLEQTNGPVIYISNHLSNSDGLILNKILGEGKVWFVAGIKLAQNDLTKFGLGIVNMVTISPNSADRSAISSVVKLVKSGHSVCIFPEGTRSRTKSLIKGKKGMLLIAKLTKVPIVPISIQGTENLLPINDQDMGREKFNFADVKVTIGDSFFIPAKEENEDKSEYEERALYFAMRRIAEILPAEYQGIYKEQ